MRVFVCGCGWYKRGGVGRFIADILTISALRADRCSHPADLGLLWKVGGGLCYHLHCTHTHTHTHTHTGEVYNIGTEQERTVVDVARDIAAYFGMPESKVVYVKDRAFNDR